MRVGDFWEPSVDSLALYKRYTSKRGIVSGCFDERGFVIYLACKESFNCSA